MMHYNRATGISTHAPRTGSDRIRRSVCLPTWEFQPTLPARGATRSSKLAILSLLISTHAPRTGSDVRQLIRRAEHTISTHAPRTGSDATQAVNPVTYTTFQPTLPARGATDFINTLLAQYGDFNPRSPHGERHNLTTPADDSASISTHAPRTGSDGAFRACGCHAGQFQPTLPARGATGSAGGSRRLRPNFNPRSPHGERRG